MYNANTARPLMMKRAYFQKDIDETLILSSQQECKEVFALSVKRLLDVNSWHECLDYSFPVFILHDKNGNTIERSTQKNDWVNINTHESEHSCDTTWMLVQDIIYRALGINNEFLLLQLRSPYTLTDDIIHNIILSRDNDTITASYYHDVEHRNTTIIPMAPISNISDTISWKELVKAFIDIE